MTEINSDDGLLNVDPRAVQTRMDAINRMGVTIQEWRRAVRCQVAPLALLGFKVAEFPYLLEVAGVGASQIDLYVIEQALVRLKVLSNDLSDLPLRPGN